MKQRIEQIIEKRAKEMTGQSRNRIFLLKSYLDIFSD